MRQIAGMDGLMERGQAVLTAWLSELEDCEDLLEILGGDVCVHGYTAREWEAFQHYGMNSEGSRELLTEATTLHQFCGVCRKSELPGAEPCFPYTPQNMIWLEQNLPVWALRRVASISDRLSGWRENWDPFGRARKGTTKPSSAGGLFGGSEEPSEN